jgi:hypothetical protein
LKITNPTFYTSSELTAYGELLNSLSVIGESLKEIHGNSKLSLYSEIGDYRNSIRKTMEKLNLESFYGRTFGFHVVLHISHFFGFSLRFRKFQWSTEIAKTMKKLAALGATYTEYYYSNESKVFRTLFFAPNYLKFLNSSKLLASKLVETFENVGSDYFFNLASAAEMKVFKLFQYLTEPQIAINQAFYIALDRIEIFSEKFENFVEISFSKSSFEEKLIRCQLFDAREKVS